MYMCVRGIVPIDADVLRSQRLPVRFPGPGIIVVVNRLMWVLGTELRSSRNAASALKC